MESYGLCHGGDHRAPRTGGSCPCGMVTLVPARKPAAPPEDDVLALLERYLREGPEALDPGAAALLRERASRLLAALDAGGGGAPIDLAARRAA